MSTTSSTNKLARKKKYVKNKAKETRESEPKVYCSEKSLVVDPKQINTPTIDSSVKESYVVTHLEYFLTRKTKSLLSG